MTQCCLTCSHPLYGLRHNLARTIPMKTCAACKNNARQARQCSGCKLRLYCVCVFRKLQPSTSLVLQGYECRKEDWVTHKPFCETARTIQDWPEERKSMWCELMRFVAENIIAVAFHYLSVILFIDNMQISAISAWRLREYITGSMSRVYKTHLVLNYVFTSSKVGPPLAPTFQVSTKLERNTGLL